MKIKTVWEYSDKTEAERLLHCARQLSVGFYRLNNFLVLPYSPKVKGVNTVTFPKLAYNSIPRFWRRVSFVDIANLPIKVPAGLINDARKLLSKADLPLPNYADIKNLWENAQAEIIAEIYKVMPYYRNRIKKIIIYPTVFGTGSSFNLINNKGEIKLYLRDDKGIATITEAIITSLTRKDVYSDLDGVWQESEIITDWLITKSSIADVIKKYSKSPEYLPTIKGVRVKQRARLMAESENFYKELGLQNNQRVFGLNGLTPEINKKPVENLSPTEKAILKLLIEKAGGVASFDEIASELFDDDRNFSLYAITKNIERLRNKLEANGVSGSYIQTLRGKGYLLKN